MWIIGGAAASAAALLGLGLAFALSASSEGSASSTGAIAAAGESGSITPEPPTDAPTSDAPRTPTDAGQSWVPATSLPGGELPEPESVAPKTYSAPTSASTAIAGQSSETIAVAIVDNYVDAINAGDYRQAYNYTTDAWQDSHSFSAFASGFDTTTISDLVITDTTSDPTVSVSYRSRQSSADGPGGATCLIWSLRFEFADDGNGYRIAKFKELGSPPYREC
jgi:hypothetical protein